MALREKLDHELVFAIAVTFVVLGMSTVITWGSKKVGLSGVASVAQHP